MKNAGRLAFRHSILPEFQSSARNTGFTLIELLVVVVIMVIIIGVSVTSIPSFSSPRQKLRSDARELLSLLKESRQTAMLRKVKIDVCVDPETGTVRAIESARFKNLTAAGQSFSEEETVDTNSYYRTVSFGEDIGLGTFPPEAVKTVFSSEDDPFAESPVWTQTEGETVALSFTAFGGASGGGISLVRDEVQLDIACDILTGDPEVVELYPSEEP